MADAKYFNTKFSQRWTAVVGYDFSSNFVSLWAVPAKDPPLFGPFILSFVSIAQCMEAVLLAASPKARNVLPENGCGELYG